MKNKKSLGQHWLKNRVILDEIADLAIKDSTKESCLEIGPGLGTLTSSLLKRFNKVIAVEFDEKLAHNLPQSFPGKNLEVINADILQFDLSLIQEPYVVVGNIPYYITSPIIEKVLTTKNLPLKIVLLIQKEVAERIASKKETVLSLFVKNHANIQLGPVVSKDEFTPPPKVDSEIIVLTPKTAEVEDKVFNLIKTGFSSPRKKLISNLSGIKDKTTLLKVFKELNINPDARPSDLTLKQWSILNQKLY